MTTAFKGLAPVERVRNLAPADFIRQFSNRHRPVIIEGVASAWPACSKWTLDFFESRMPSRVVPIEVRQGDLTRNDAGTYFTQMKKVRMEVRKYIQLHRAGGPTSYYLSEYPILKDEPALAGDIGDLEPYFDFPSFFPARLRRLLKAPPLLWLGPGNTVSTLHFDLYQNLFVQLSGRKRFTLISPDQSRRLYYPNKDFGMLGHFSPVDVEKPDLSRHPRVAEIEALECVVEPGEMLFIPIHWWHNVRAIEPSVSMNFWWWPIARTLWYGRDHISYAVKAMLRRARTPQIPIETDPALPPA